MLEEVGHPTVVNPDRVLRREALERGWPILTFSNPTPLLPTLELATGPIVGVGAIVLAVGAAVLSFARDARRPA